MNGLNMNMGMSNWGNYGNYGTMIDPNQFSSLGSELPPIGTSMITGMDSGAPGFLSLDSFLGKNGKQGWGNLALGAAQGIGGAYMGMKQYGLARDALAQSQNQFNQNYAAQRQTINTQLEDRQRARVAASAGQAESVDSYLDRNRIR